MAAGSGGWDWGDDDEEEEEEGGGVDAADDVDVVGEGECGGGGACGGGEGEGGGGWGACWGGASLGGLSEVEGSIWACELVSPLIPSLISSEVAEFLDFLGGLGDCFAFFAGAVGATSVALSAMFVEPLGFSTLLGSVFLCDEGEPQFLDMLLVRTLLLPELPFVVTLGGISKCKADEC
jgi:hypothetical protein